MKLSRLTCAVLLSLGAVAMSDEPVENAAQPASTFSVMTFNIRYDNPRDGVHAWPFRKERVAEILKSQDLFGLQEVLSDQLADLKTRLPDHSFYSVPRTGKPGEKNAGEACTIGYRTDSFERLAEGTFWLSETPDVLGSKSWDSSLPRIASWLKLKQKSTGRTFLLANTHFDHRGREARAESASVIRREVTKVSDGLPVILTGDFNCFPGSEPIDTLTAPRVRATGEVTALGPRFREAATLSVTPRVGPTWTSSGFVVRERQPPATPQPNRQIDMIFVTPGVSVRDYAVIDTAKDGRYASDHLPVRATVMIEKSDR